MSKKILNTIIGLITASVLSTSLVAVAADISPVLKAPQHRPYLTQAGNYWVASTYKDSSSLHEDIAQYKLCFYYAGHEGTHDVYKVAIYGGYPWYQGRGIAHQEGDQVFIHADASRGRKLTTQWELVAGPGKISKNGPMMGTGHWLEWGGISDKRFPEFRNVRFDKRGSCHCQDKECTTAEFPAEQ